MERAPQSFLFFCFSIFLLLAAQEILRAEELPPLAEKTAEIDCEKCHRAQVLDLQEAGAGHALLSCRDCHSGHPPRNPEVIPRCSVCHQGAPHLDRKGPCLACHQNPHRPLELVLTRKAEAACLDCHPGPGRDFAAFPTMHARFACISCHERHGNIFSCLECHEPHIAGDDGAINCRDCHPPHRPLPPEYSPEIDPTACLACHQETGELLLSSASRHRFVPCIDCHQDRHGAIPVCELCHPEPHAERILERHPECGTCHGRAHALIR